MTAWMFVDGYVEVEAAVAESGNVWLYIGDDVIVGHRRGSPSCWRPSTEALAGLPPDGSPLGLVEGDATDECPVLVDLHRLRIDVHSCGPVPVTAGVNGTPVPPAADSACAATPAVSAADR